MILLICYPPLPLRSRALVSSMQINMQDIGWKWKGGWEVELVKRSENFSNTRFASASKAFIGIIHERQSWRCTENMARNSRLIMNEGINGFTFRSKHLCDLSPRKISSSSAAGVEQFSQKLNTFPHTKCWYMSTGKTVFTVACGISEKMVWYDQSCHSLEYMSVRCMHEMEGRGDKQNSATTGQPLRAGYPLVRPRNENQMDEWIVQRVSIFCGNSLTTRYCMN